MKLLNHPIDMIAVFDVNGDIKPFKFKYKDKKIKVEKIIDIKEEKLAGNRRLVFVCMTDRKDIYELKYEIDSHKWFLFKR
ncbi:MAG: hypothetical protein H0S78_02265 [Tissierellales bacterium]|nr:hypothetical protein [Tissierellales bacterium]HCX03647.1 hypothetical protein [Clostridiales bacterium]